MFLNRDQIVLRLRMGDLLLDPAPDQSQIGIISVDLRLGTQIAEFTPRAGITIDLTAGVAPFEALKERKRGRVRSWLFNNNLPVLRAL